MIFQPVELKQTFLNYYWLFLCIAITKLVIKCVGLKINFKYIIIIQKLGRNIVYSALIEACNK